MTRFNGVIERVERVRNEAGGTRRTCSRALDGGRRPGAVCVTLAALTAAFPACVADRRTDPVPAAFPWDSLARAGPPAGLAIGFTSSFEKVFSRPPLGFTGVLGDSAELLVARNERESVQLVLFPVTGLEGVTVDVGDPKPIGASAVAVPPRIELRVVGEVDLLHPRTAGGRAGWHPDPLLPGRPLRLEPRVPRSLLVTVHADEGVDPGRYRSTLTLRAGGDAVARVTLSIGVWDITLPHVPRFKTASFADWGVPERMWPPDQGYTVPSDAERMRWMLELAELGFENRLPPTVYLASGLRSWNRRGDGGTDYGYPTHDRTADGGRAFNAARTDSLLDFMLERGANHFFLGTTADIYRPPAGTDERRERLIAYLSDYAAHLRSRGLLDMALVYDVDEPWGDAVEHARETYTLIKRRVGPDVRVMQNTNQNTPGAISRFLGFFDALDINLGFHDVLELDRYRLHRPDAFGEVWWNLNLWPDARPNLFLEYPLIDARMIGPLSWAFGIDGFEYWQLFSSSSMGRYHPVAADELRVRWEVNDRSLDGTLVYPGADHRVFSSLRLESLRDGFEDYELLALLEATDPGNALLTVPIVGGLADYEEDPARVLAFRRRVAEAILAARRSGGGG